MSVNRGSRLTARVPSATRGEQPIDSVETAVAFGSHRRKITVAASKEAIVPTAATPLDGDIVEACRRGDRVAFARLYEVRKDRVHSLAWYMTGDPAAAEDIAQQVFLKLFDAFKTFRHEAHVDSWLYQVTLNACRDHNRRARRARLFPLEYARALLSPVPDPEASGTQEEIRDAVRRVVARLSPKLRAVVLLKYVAELSYVEIAETLRCSIGTVGSRLNRAHEILARDLRHISEWV